MSALAFGTSGLRGLAAELQTPLALAHVRAFCQLMRASGAGDVILVGRDLRASSHAIASLCMGVIADAGLTPADCGVAPTPAIALAAASGGTPAVMVTGSHLADDRNGLKFYRHDGEISKADEARIAAMASRQPQGDAVSPALAAQAITRDVCAPYCARYVRFFGPNALRGMNVGVYQHSSAGRDVAVRILAQVGATPVPLGRSDTFIAIDTEAVTPGVRAMARRWARARALDAIVSMDADADRALIGDARGRFLPGDVIGAMTAYWLGADVVVTPFSTRASLEQQGLFPEVVRTRVGSPHVISAMERARMGGAMNVMGFEANGGVLLGADLVRHGRRLLALPTRDAMLPIICCLALAREYGVTLAQLAAGAARSCMLTDRLAGASVDRAEAFLRRLGDDGAMHEAAFAHLGAVISAVRDDGVRLVLETGAAVRFRLSGNAPELRVYAEAPQRRAAAALLRAAVALARREVQAPEAARPLR